MFVLVLVILFFCILSILIFLIMNFVFFLSEFAGVKIVIFVQFIKSTVFEFFGKPCFKIQNVCKLVMWHYFISTSFYPI